MGIERKDVVMEIENMLTYIDRIKLCLDSLKENAEVICLKCIICREERLGIDLVLPYILIILLLYLSLQCTDWVDKELRKEIEVIQGAQNLMRRTLEMANEQVRRLRSTLYFLDRDLESKENVKKIDENNLSISQNSMHLSMYHGFAPLDYWY